MSSTATGILVDIRSTEETEFLNKNSVFYKVHNDLPLNDMSNYITEYNLNHQTPLMYAVILNKPEYIKQLIKYDICRIDDFNKTAYDYALENRPLIDPSIIDALAEYETPIQIEPR